MGEEPERGIRRDDKSIHSLNRLEDGERVRVVVREQHVGQTGVRGDSAAGHLLRGRDPDGRPADARAADLPSPAGVLCPGAA